MNLIVVILTGVSLELDGVFSGREAVPNDDDFGGSMVYNFGVVDGCCSVDSEKLDWNGNAEKSLSH